MNSSHQSARDKFLALSLESTRKSYYPQLQKHLEKTRENEKRLQLLIDTLPAQISYVNSKERYELINREFEKTFDLRRDQIIGRRVETIIGEKNYHKVKSHIKRALSGKSGHFEFYVSDTGKQTKWYEINYVAETDDQGNVNGFYALTIDLTDKKKAEEERLSLKDKLRQAQKMEAIGTLSGGIAHDFNNILSGIFGYTELAGSYINDPQQAKEYINKIFESAKRASSLIQQILTFSRQTKYSKQPLSLFSSLKEILVLIRSSFPSNIDIKEKLNTKTMILADSTQIHQVIMNLCTNAYHAMANEGGVLNLELDEIELKANQIRKNGDPIPGKYLRLQIRDTGRGIDPSIKDKIFDPYFTTKKRGKGTGLGLAIVNGIVKKHDGFIDFKSQMDVGTCFQVYFPVFEDQKSDSYIPGGKTDTMNIGSENIMLVDDEPAILETMKAILSQKGYKISTFDNGKSALQAFKKEPDYFDLIITDMTMPQMTGDKLSKEILEIRPHIPIILCTGYHETFSKEDAFKTGIKKYIHKPVIGKELSKIIRDLLNYP